MRLSAIPGRYEQRSTIGNVRPACSSDRSLAAVKADFYDPTGEKARAVKARYVGVCRGCGTYIQPRNGKGEAWRYCRA